MIRRTLAFILLICVGCTPILGLAQAEGPVLSQVFPGDDTLTLGETVLEIEYDASVAGTVYVKARIRGSEGDPQLVDEHAVAAGPGVVVWDGTLGDAPADPGSWVLFLTLVDASGATSMACAVEVMVTDPNARPTVVPAEARPKITPSPDRQLSEFPDPHEKCFWNMDIDNLDPENPDDAAVIWEIMMQSITVIDIGSKEHYYPIAASTDDLKDATKYTAQLTGTTQGVHVLEATSDGWSHIEAYSLDGYGAPRKFIREFTGKLCNGYIRSDKLKTVKPNQEMGLLVDKLRQRLYVFQNGVMTGVLKISTGKPTESQPNAETPAGEFLTESRVGMFMNGNMYCDYAIRIADGTLLHEVPFVERADGTRNYASFEQFLGKKASHGCVRVSKEPNEQGMNMKWLWNNVERNTKVLVWDDKGRTLPPPDPATSLYYNPEGGKNYHLDQRCSGVKDRFLPLTGFLYGELNNPPYDKLTPCKTCQPPERHEDESLYYVPDEIIGVIGEDTEGTDSADRP